VRSLCREICLSLAFSAGWIEGALLDMADRLSEPDSSSNLMGDSCVPRDVKLCRIVYLACDPAQARSLDVLFETSDPSDP
jgi:hypothetical protein